MNGVSKKRKREFSTFRRYVVHRPTSAFESKKLDTISEIIVINTSGNFPSNSIPFNPKEI